MYAYMYIYQCPTSADGGDVAGAHVSLYGIIARTGLTIMLTYGTRFATEPRLPNGVLRDCGFPKRKRVFYFND